MPPCQEARIPPIARVPSVRCFQRSRDRQVASITIRTNPIWYTVQVLKRIRVKLNEYWEFEQFWGTQLYGEEGERKRPSSVTPPRYWVPLPLLRPPTRKSVRRLRSRLIG